MPLAYNRWSEEDLKSRNIVEEGEYPFYIVTVSTKKTKPGIDKNGEQKIIKDMIEIDFNFTDNNGVVKKIKDWILLVPEMDWKLRVLADSVGLIELYDDMQLDCHHLIHKKGIFKLGIKDAEDKDKNKFKTNFVKEYIKQSTAQLIDEDIPL